MRTEASCGSSSGWMEASGETTGDSRSTAERASGIVPALLVFFAKWQNTKKAMRKTPPNTRNGTRSKSNQFRSVRWVNYRLSDAISESESAGNRRDDRVSYY